MSTETSRSAEGNQAPTLFAARGWIAPTQIELVGDQLVYQSPWLGAKTKKQVRPSQRMLRAFVALAGGRDVDVLEFARTWGVLELCRHDLPCSHPPAFGEWPCVPMQVSKDADACHEPISVWRAMAAEARAITDIAAKLQWHQPRQPANWRPIRHAQTTALAVAVAETGKFPLRQTASLCRDTHFDRAVLADIVADSWLSDGDVRPRFDAETLRLVIQGIGLFGAIAVNLMLHVNGAKQLAICSNPDCGMPFEQTKPPSRGSRAFCEFCREGGVPHKIAARESAARIRKRRKQGGDDGTA